MYAIGKSDGDKVLIGRGEVVCLLLELIRSLSAFVILYSAMPNTATSILLRSTPRSLYSSFINSSDAVPKVDKLKLLLELNLPEFTTRKFH